MNLKYNYSENLVKFLNKYAQFKNKFFCIKKYSLNSFYLIIMSNLKVNFMSTIFYKNYVGSEKGSVADPGKKPFRIHNTA